MNWPLFHFLWKLDLATSGKGGVGPYISICVIVCFIGVSSANVQGGMMGELSFMHPELIQVNSAEFSLNVLSVHFPIILLYILIQNGTMFCSPFLLVGLQQGLLTSVLRLLTKAAFEKSDNGLRKGACRYIFFNDEEKCWFHSLHLLVGDLLRTWCFILWISPILYAFLICYSVHNCKAQHENWGDTKIEL